MTSMLSILGILGFLFVVTLLICIYELKKGQIKMHDNEIPIEKVIFKEDYEFYDLLY